MELRCLTADHEFDALQGEWNTLAQSSAADMPFTRYEFLRTWWRTRGGGEWPHAALRLMEARESGALVGLAPFFRTLEEGRAAWLLLGSHEISDYLDLIATPGREADMVRLVLDFAATQPPDEFETLDFYNLRAGAPSLEALRALAPSAGWRVETEDEKPCPSIALPRSWQAYLEQLDKKQRHEVRRKVRRGEGGEHELAWAIVDREAKLQEEIDSFLALMQLDERKARFLTPAMAGQLRACIEEAHRAGWLQLAFLTVDGRRAAGYLNFDYANRIWVYNSGFDPEYAALSPGWVLLARLIEWAIDHGREAFDFMRGNEGYKFQWGGVSRPIYHLRLGRPVR